MAYDIEDFEVGDEIKYIHECDDHEEATVITDGNFMINGYYHIVSVDKRGGGLLLDIGTNEDEEVIEWWVPASCVQLLKIPEPRPKYWKVIRKIQQMDKRRKEQGYAY